MSKRILVIDDDEFVRKSFKLALKKTGYQVDTAESGEKGVEMEKKEKYDLIFLDLKMPGMNGVETLRLLREIDAQSPIYVATAFHKEFIQELESAVKDGVNFELLRKPLDNNQITFATKSIIEDKAGDS